MVKLFCPKCYHGNEYCNSPPRFCGQCGASFSSSVASLPDTIEKPRPARIPKTLKARRPVEEEYDLEEDSENEEVEIPQIDKIEIEPTNYRPNTEKFGQVAGSGKTGEVRPRGKGGKAPSKKAIKENWAQMFPTQRKSISIGPEE